MCTQHSLGTLLTGIGEDMNRELALSTCYKVVLYKKMPLTQKLSPAKPINTARLMFFI